MPIHIKLNGGTYNGFIQGDGEYYDSDTQTILKGTFDKGKLIGNDGILIDYTNNSFNYFIGSYDNNLPNGVMIVYKYNEDMIDDKLPLDQLNSNVIVNKYECLYSEGELISSINIGTIGLNILIEYKETISKFICNFTLYIN
jgi:hypothetical protein